MAATVQVATTGKLDYEVSAGEDGTLTGSQNFTIGASGSIVQFLTLRTVVAGKTTVKAVSGKLSVEQDGGKGKKISQGKSLTLSAKVKRALVKEAV